MTENISKIETSKHDLPWNDSDWGTSNPVSRPIGLVLTGAGSGRSMLQAWIAEQVAARGELTIEEPMHLVGSGARRAEHHETWVSYKRFNALLNFYPSQVFDTQEDLSTIRKSSLIVACDNREEWIGPLSPWAEIGTSMLIGKHDLEDIPEEPLCSVLHKVGFVIYSLRWLCFCARNGFRKNSPEPMIDALLSEKKESVMSIIRNMASSYDKAGMPEKRAKRIISESPYVWVNSFVPRFVLIHVPSGEVVQFVSPEWPENDAR